MKFTFDGRPYEARRGDTLAAALIRNGVHLMGRSFKYHRPRGVLAAGAEEPNALVEIDRGGARRTPNLRATVVEVFDGMVARSQNRTPSLRFDVGAVNDLLAPFLPPGFYYKTFMWPIGAWAKLYEPLIRRAAGLGRAPDLPDTDRYTQRFAHCDVLVIGAGPAGLAAAAEAAAAGMRVMLCDEQAEFGGSLLSDPAAAAGLHETLAALFANPRATMLCRTTAFGIYGDNLVGLAERVTDHLPDPDPALPRERLWQVRAKRIVVAAGAIERPLVFPGNDRPGIMLGDAARIFATRYGANPGRNAVVVTACDTGADVARDLAASGVRIARVIDLREGFRVTGTSGRLRVSFIGIERGGAREKIPCDLVAMCGGWTPSIHLYSQARGKPRFDAALGAFVPDTEVSNLICVGACAGDMPGAYRAGIAPVSSEGRAFVDFQNDVTAKDLELATREGFRSIEHVKRYTTTGMATDQGKTSNINALGIVAGALGATIPEIGLTTFRTPYTPVTFGTLAGHSRGDLFDPVRTTPMHQLAVAAGAVFEDVGTWKRARYFPRAAEDMHMAVARECRMVRDSVGMFDATTLGEIEVVGADAAEFMNRVYINAWTRLAPGRCRYGVMLGENGFVMDDGVVGRLAPDRFHVTTTTGGAARVLAAMEDYRQTEWPELRVWLTSVSEQWAVIAVQGPRAREALLPLVDGLDISAAVMPHMSVVEGTFLGIEMRLFRVSFSGEMGFEVNVPADYGHAAWEAISARVGACQGGLYGTEAMHVLRAEKGFIIVGQETDGTATPDDVGLAWAIGKAKPDFIGKRSLTRSGMSGPRRQLVGLRTDDPATVLEEGAQITATTDDNRPLGHVTSAYGGATVGHSIALAMIESGRDRLGATLQVRMPGRAIAVRVTAPVFYDPEGARLDA